MNIQIYSYSICESPLTAYDDITEAKKDSKICRKVSNGEFECPSKEPASTALAIPWYSQSHPALLINPSGEFCAKKNRPEPNLV